MRTFLLICLLTIATSVRAHDGANFVAADMLKSMSGNDKAAILMLYFGTTHDDTRALTIDRLTAQVRETFPELHVREAYTSRTVVQRLAKRDIRKQTPLEALEWLKKHGYTHIVVQPTSIIEGVEMEAIRREMTAAAAGFKEIRIGHPLLYAPADYKAAANVLAAAVPSDRATVWVGHGTYMPATAQYAMLDYVMAANGHRNHFVATLEGYPMLPDVAPRLAQAGTKRLLLCPLMFVAGDHAKNDIDGDIKDELRKQGYEVETRLQGLGEYDGIRAIFINHIRFSLHHKMNDIIERKKLYATPGYEYGHEDHHHDH